MLLYELFVLESIEILELEVYWWGVCLECKEFWF